MTQRQATIRERFPPPWRAEPTGGGFQVLDSRDVVVAYVYSRDDVRSVGNKVYLTTEEARAVAMAIARLPDLATKGDR